MALAVHDVEALAGNILDEVERAVIGKRAQIELVLMGLLADGHVLIEDFPGLAKTLIARSVARVCSMRFSRIQFTPDLMPSDVTGSAIYDQRDAVFRFQAGPVFANLLLADEINRAPPKTQAALLEAMQEQQVTADGHTHPLERPFIVLATQNPIEYEGTYPLPEAQLDRFLMRVSVGYPATTTSAGSCSSAPRVELTRSSCRSSATGRRCSSFNARSRRCTSRSRSPRTWSTSCRPRGTPRKSRWVLRRAARWRCSSCALLGCAPGQGLRHPRRREGDRRARARAQADAAARAVGAAGERRGRRARLARDGPGSVDTGGSGLLTTSASPRLAGYAALAAAGMLTALASGRPAFAALSAPLALFLGAAVVASPRPQLRVGFSLETAKMLEGAR